MSKITFGRASGKGFSCLVSCHDLLPGLQCDLFLSCEMAIDVFDICEGFGWPVSQRAYEQCSLEARRLLQTALTKLSLTENSNYSDKSFTIFS